MKLVNSTVRLAVGLTILGGLTACGSDNEPVVSNPPPTPPPIEMKTFEVTLSNLTYGQPLSPAALLLRNEGALWEIGQMASVEVERIAEGGDNSALLSLAGNKVTASADGPLEPGMSQTFSLQLEATESANLTLVTMLVNTNDAFTGLTGLNLDAMQLNDSWSMTSGIYDAGTEANSELAGTIPGPADGGVGFDAMRDDVDFVAMHPGVVRQDDGKADSVLTQMHRFDNPAIRIRITRVE
ncbi:spondin domain-containing protein [Bowmanella yangjiangensis]|uniref:Spondin domain-containing protein n=1 Tax=Bowmanella yangjiangensis TaxID=2811230 RepID=A0ABS3CXQ0_9ALTE|nr:spondin domain-containing protein [Bowmanella yangjiangensis]MBN7821899.1 spondin domain-containing protein [Bowmanella yangjiangensis]